MNGQKVLKTRMIQKHEYEADWLKSDFIPLESEIVVYDAEADQNGNLFEGVKLPDNRIIPFNYARIKIGDGQTKINDLPFIDGVGKETPEGGEIFNDYLNNKAIGEGTSTRGINTQAGNKAFKILKIIKLKKYEEVTGEWELDYLNLYRSGEGTFEVVGTYEDPYVREDEDYTYYETSFNIGSGSTMFYIHVPLGNPNPFIAGESYLLNYTNVWDEATDSEIYSINSIKHINPNVVDNSHQITVRGDVTQGDTPYVIGDLLQVECKLHYNNCLKIANIEIENNNSIITVVPVDNRVLNSDIQMDDPTGQDMNEDWVYVVGKDGEEVSPQLTSAFASGKNSKATGFASAVFGRDNIASGNYSTVLGRGNVGGYASLVAGVYSEAGNGGMALGNSVRALGDSSVATGVNTYARAASSRAGGRQSEALSEFTVAEGLGVIAGLKQGQVVHGKYNVRSDSDLFVIGDGTANDKRHNALRITEDYKVFLNNDTIELANVEQVDNVLVGAKAVNDKNNKATGVMALATGSGTTASGQGSLAGGVGSQATARSAVAVGEYNKATMQGSFAGGINAEAKGFSTVALGYGVQTTNSSPVYGQMAAGKYNLPNAYSLFMVGNGTSKDDRKNVFEVRKDGSAYLETQGSENNSVVIKSHLDSRIADIVNQLASAGLQREVVETLPEISSANETTIYMVANNSENEQNVYDEYMLINGNWEIIGSTAVDLTSKPGEKTVDGGEIFNDYENNEAIGNGTTAKGINTQAGNKAFKVLSIEKGTGESYTLGEEIQLYKTFQITNLKAKPGVYKYVEWIYHRTNPGMPAPFDVEDVPCYALETANGHDNIYYCEWTSDLDSNVFEDGEYYYIDSIPEDRIIRSVRKVSDYKVVSTDDFIITVRGDATQGETPYAKNDNVQVECKGHFTEALKIVDIAKSGSNTAITVTPINPEYPWGAANLKVETSDPDNSENWLYVVGKNIGEDANPQSKGAIAMGDGSVATGWGSLAAGRDNKAYGNYSTAVGRQNTAGYAAFATGRKNVVLSQHGFAAGSSNTVVGNTGSAALGVSNIVLASYANALGRENEIITTGNYSLVSGYKNKSTTEGQLIGGKFNNPSSSHLFQIGNGTSDSDRNNAFTVDKNGNVNAVGEGHFNTVYSNNSEVVTKVTTVGQLTENGGVIVNNEAGKSSCSATGLGAFAAGNNSKALNRSAVAFGEGSTAKYIGTFAAGLYTTANGYSSVALGLGTQTASGATNIVGGQTAVGRYNKTSSDGIFIVGIGSAGYTDDSGNKVPEVRSNAFEVKNDGSAWLQTQGLKPNSVVIKSYLDEALANINGGGSAINNGKLLLDNGLEIRTSIEDGESYNYIKIGKNIDDDNPLEIQMWDAKAIFGHGHMSFSIRDYQGLTIDYNNGTVLSGGSSLSIDADRFSLSGTDITLQRWGDAPSDNSILTKKEIDNNIKSEIELLANTMGKELVKVYPGCIIYTGYLEGKRVYELKAIRHVVDDGLTNAYEFDFVDVVNNSYEITCFYYASQGEDVSNSNFIQNAKYIIDASINKNGYQDPQPVLNSAYIVKDSTEMELVDKVTGEKYKIYIENGELKTKLA